MSRKNQNEERNVSTQERGNTTEGRNEQSQALQTSNAGGRQAGLTRGGDFDSFFGGGPAAFMQRFRDEVDRLFEDFGFGRNWLAPWSERGGSIRPRGFAEFGSAWSPQVEVFERGGRLVVRADLPGLRKEDVKVEIADDAVVISGERKNEFEENRDGYYRSERSYGSFLRRIPLPEGVSADDADASFRNGVLEVTMQAPQRQSRSRQIEITDGGEPRAQGQSAGSSSR